MRPRTEATDLAGEMGLKVRGVFMPLRAADRKQRQPLFDSLACLGRK